MNLDLNTSKPQTQFSLDELGVLDKTITGLPDGDHSVRVLGEDDLVHLERPRSLSAGTGRISGMRARHHGIAMRLAVGMRPAEICQEIGCSSSHLSNLQISPAFQELLVTYQKRAEERVLDLGTQIQSVTEDALEEIRKRLANGQIKDNNLILTIFKELADRAGYGPVQKVLSGTVQLSSDELNRAKSKVRDNVPKLTEPWSESDKMAETPPHQELDISELQE